MNPSPLSPVDEDLRQLAIATAQRAQYQIARRRYRRTVARTTIWIYLPVQAFAELLQIDGVLDHPDGRHLLNLLVVLGAGLLIILPVVLAIVVAYSQEINPDHVPTPSPEATADPSPNNPTASRSSPTLHVATPPARPAEYWLCEQCGAFADSVRAIPHRPSCPQSVTYLAPPAQSAPPVRSRPPKALPPKSGYDFW